MLIRTEGGDKNVSWIPICTEGGFPADIQLAILRLYEKLTMNVSYRGAQTFAWQLGKVFLGGRWLDGKFETSS